MILYEVIETAWGPFVAISDKNRLLGTHLPHPSIATEDDVHGKWPNAKSGHGSVPGLRQAVRAYFAGTPTELRFKVDLTGMTDFRKSVMEAAMRVPYGRTASYRDLARAAGRPGAARAVGTFMANNPLPLIVPCHRIVRSDGSIGGFSAVDGVALKERLLALEGVTRFTATHALAG